LIDAREYDRAEAAYAFISEIAQRSESVSKLY
jgi:hypothetical protein